MPHAAMAIPTSAAQPAQPRQQQYLGVSAGQENQLRLLQQQEKLLAMVRAQPPEPTPAYAYKPESVPVGQTRPHRTNSVEQLLGLLEPSQNKR